MASRKGLCGLVKRDGKGTVVTPFTYIGIQKMEYYIEEAVDENRNIHIGYRKADGMVRDLLVDGKVVVSGADWLTTCRVNSIKPSGQNL